jgi:hypothetical protein
MAYIRRWVGRFILALMFPVLLSACGLQQVKFDNQINTPALSTQPLFVLSAPQQDTFSLTEFAIASEPEQVAKDHKTERLIKFVASRFKKPEEFARRIVTVANKYARPDFPRAEDILAIIAVESTFNTNARYRGSWGLMQIEAKSHRKQYVGESLTNVETNIRVGSEVLSQYYEITKSKQGAIVAYNVGIGNFLSGHKNRPYLKKVNKELALLEIA